MNRRTFLRKMMFAAAAAYLLPGILTADRVRAAVFNQKTSLADQVTVKETHLFFHTLENRTVTDGIVIHHVGGTNADVSAAQIHQWHLNNGWAGIGYHYVIRKDGTIERGRPRDTIGAHCYGENQHTIGINLVGEFDSFEPTAAQLRSAVQLMGALCQIYRLYPASDAIFGHRDFCSTACPGDNLYAQLPDLRQRVEKLLRV